ncbi:MAG: hypothetical protein PHO66_04315, partial [Eubacteriales bacterium]|nr:hypothetical protein [Eubacteriales bacterium]
MRYVNVFRSLFIRLLTVYLAVALVLVGGLTLAIAGIYQSEYYQERMTALHSEATALAALSATSFLSLSPSTDNMLAQAYVFAAQRYDAAVWVVNKTGKITSISVDTAGQPRSDAQDSFQSMTKDEFQQYFARVMRGEVVQE